MSNKFRGISLFSSSGIDEYYLNDINFKIIAANELIENRANLYKKLYPDSEMINGDIQNIENKQKLIDIIKKKKVDFLIITPPCQGVSLIGKNKSQNDMLLDKRNYLLFDALDLVKIADPSFFLIENVPRYDSLYLPYKDKYKKIEDILKYEFSNYIFNKDLIDCSNYGIPQKRKRIIYRLHKKNIQWNLPKKETVKTLRDAIGHLPSLESGENSGIPWHFARSHNKDHIKWMKNTPEGKSAFLNKIHFPKKKSGERIKGFQATYSRMYWDEPCPTITMRNDAISSQSNVHPGRLLENGTYSDSRVLTILELLILSSLTPDVRIPLDTNENLLRRCLGECFPPLMLKKILENIKIL